MQMQEANFRTKMFLPEIKIKSKVQPALKSCKKNKKSINFRLMNECQVTSVVRHIVTRQ